jgi:hypothetical protein
MGRRLIPRSDRAFLTKLECFAGNVGKDPARFALSRDDAGALSASAVRFRAAFLRARNGGTRGAAATREKDEARAEAERLYKRCHERVRVNGEALDTEAKLAAGLGEPAGRRRARAVPQEPPNMWFARALFAGNGAAPVHELTFRALNGTGKAKPAGAVRLELFCDLIGPDEPVPEHPGANHGGRPWYLRSFSRSPIRITPPMSRVPMVVVYWGRWADAVGNVGPWCKTVVSRVEGHSPHLWIGTRRPLRLIEDPAGADARRPEKYSVAVRDAQYEYLNPAEVAAPPLPAPKDGETRQLEGPAADEAAEAA